MMLNKFDKNEYLKRYNKRLRRYGYNSKTLGWGGGQIRQYLRYGVLLEIRNFINQQINTVLDVGCGFADLATYLEKEKLDISYVGVDINNNLLNIAKTNHDNKLNVKCMDILDNNSVLPVCDIVLESGIFNAQLKKQDQYTYIEKMLKKMFALSNYGIAADFMSTKVDFIAKDAFHMDPRILFEISQDISRKVILRHDYLPFEYCIYILH